jgi:phosphohistidine phosphatase SixA
MKTRSRPFLPFAVLLGFLATGGGPGAAIAQEPTVVILVRHAEKATPDPPDADPPLTVAGRARARALAEALADAGVDAVITSQWQRTRLTAAPLAERLEIEPEVISTSGAQAQPEAVAEAIRTRHAGQTVLVVGHSNTLHEVIAALGGSAVEEICESQYADLLVLVLDGGGEAPALIRTRYGVPSPPPGPECEP